MRKCPTERLVLGKLKMVNKTKIIMFWLECNENDTPGLSGDLMHKDQPLLSSKNQGWKIIALWLLSQTYFNIWWLLHSFRHPATKVKYRDFINLKRNNQLTTNNLLNYQRIQRFRMYHKILLSNLVCRKQSNV